MNKETNSIQKLYVIFFAGLLLIAFNLKNVISASASENVSAPKSDLYVEDTSTPTAPATSTPTATGTLVSSRTIVLDYVGVNYPNGTSGVTVTQENTCQPTVQGGLHCTFTGSGSTWKSLRGVQPYARFHWSDGANARRVYRYQVATVSHTNEFHYGNVVPLDFFGYGLPDGYHEWSGIGSYANCSTAYCDAKATFYMLGGYGTYTWFVDTYIAPVAIDIYAPTVTPTLTATSTPTPTVTPSQTPTIAPTSTPTCSATDLEVQAVTGSNGTIPFYGVGGTPHVWDSTVAYDGDYINSIWIYKDAQNIVELGWIEKGEYRGGERTYFRTWTVNGIYHSDYWGTPSINTDHNFQLYNVNSDQEWRFFVDGVQRTPSIPGNFYLGLTQDVFERWVI